MRSAGASARSGHFLDENSPHSWAPTQPASGPTNTASTKSKRRGRPTDATLDPCARCQQPGARLPKRAYCPACEARFRAKASAWQERDYLHAYLHTRLDENSRHLRMLRTRAKRLGLMVSAPPPAPMVFDRRLAIVAGRKPADWQPAPKVKRAAKKKKKGSDAA